MTRPTAMGIADLAVAVVLAAAGLWWVRYLLRDGHRWDQMARGMAWVCVMGLLVAVCSLLWFGLVGVLRG